MHKTHSLSVVIPVYNSASTLQKLTSDLENHLNLLKRPFEIVLVNDGSSDASWERIAELNREHDHIHGINLMRNYGQHNALLCGIRAAKNEIIVTLDDDLQQSPRDITRLLDKLDEGWDVVYGEPLRQPHGFFRNLSSRATKWLLRNAMGGKTACHTSPFRIFHARLRDTFSNYQNPYVLIDVLLAWTTSRICAVPVEYERRQTGASNYNLVKLITHAVNMIIGFSTLPLRVASFIGFSFTLFGACILAYVLGRYLIAGTSVPGFPFLASTISILTGAQLFVLGIIGEYLARMYSRTMERPAYVIRQEVNKPLP